MKLSYAGLPTMKMKIIEIEVTYWKGIAPGDARCENWKHWLIEGERSIPLPKNIPDDISCEEGEILANTIYPEFIIRYNPEKRRYEKADGFGEDGHRLSANYGRCPKWLCQEIEKNQGGVER